MKTAYNIQASISQVVYVYGLNWHEMLGQKLKAWTPLDKQF